MLVKGSTVKIVRYLPDCSKSYRHRLMSMGLLPNAEFLVIRVAPLGDPIEIKVKNTCLTLRRKELDMLSLEVI